MSGKNLKIFDKLIYGLVLIFAVYMIFSIMRVKQIDLSGFESFNMVFISILMQAFPFMILGIFISSVVHVFVPNEVLLKIFPTKNGLGFIAAMFAGILLPVCECATVPLMKGLVKKGVKLPIAITFMLSAPIVNPIAIMSTVYAFPSMPFVVFIRLGLGLFCALVIGLLFFIPALGENVFQNCENDDCEEHSCCCGCHSNNDKSIFEKIKLVFIHITEEFFSAGKYLIIGAFLASAMQRFVPEGIISGFSSNEAVSLTVMMLMAFCFSACSTSDAFIARSFSNSFSLNSLMGFMVFGPMLDIKNMCMLFDGFNKKFVLKLCAVIFAVDFLVLIIASIFI